VRVHQYQLPKLLVHCLILLMSFNVEANDLTDTMLKEYQLKEPIPFSSDAGRLFWYKDNNGRSCTTCHTDSVLIKGRHERTGKILEPMAPSVNPERLTSRKKVNKWFLRNCKWTVGRECTTKEKGNILLWLSQQ